VSDPAQIPSGGELGRALALLADLDAIVWEADPATLAFTFVSDGARALLGHEPAVWLADERFWVDHLHPADRDRTLARIRRAASGGGSFDVTYRFRSVDGSWLRLRDIGHAVLGADGRPTALRGLMVATGAPTPADAGTTEGEDRFRRVVEQLPAIVYLATAAEEDDTPGTLLYVSPQVTEILGFAPEEWVGDPVAWARQFHPADRGRVRAAYERVAREGGDLSTEYRMYAKDGSLRWFRDEARLVRDDAGVPRYWQGSMVDVTTERRSEARAVESRAELAEVRAREQALIEQIPAVVYVDPLEEGPTRYISPQVETLLGYTPAEWYADGSLRPRLVHPDDRAKLAADTDAAATTYRLRAKDGRTVWIQDHAQLVRDETGTPIYWLGVLFDVTEQHRLLTVERQLDDERREAERLRAEDEMKTTFLQAVSHDLRTPLAAILGLSVTLERDDVTLDREETRDLARRITANARKLDGIVSDFLDLERLRRGLAVPRTARVDLGALIRELVANSELVAGRRLALEVAPLTIEADPAMVERVVENLLGNAVKHTPGDARIWVRLEREDEGALLVVEDDGPGVPPGLREAMFEPYRQGDDSAAGSGVGLALVRRFAELHGGTAWVQPRAGGGSSFRVRLAWHPPASSGSAQPTASGSSTETQA
jgi:PAS domain S-box-containing protein